MERKVALEIINMLLVNFPEVEVFEGHTFVTVRLGNEELLSEDYDDLTVEAIEAALNGPASEYELKSLIHSWGQAVNNSLYIYRGKIISFGNKGFVIMGGEDIPAVEKQVYFTESRIKAFTTLYNID